MIEIREVQHKRERRAFVDFPYQLNKDNKSWVPPLRLAEWANINTDTHPFYQGAKARFYIATDKGKTVGRIASIFYKKTKQGYFGFLQSVDNQGVFNKLLNQAEADLKSLGAKEIVGPVCPSINYEMGVLVQGFDTPPFIMLPHNPPYYDRAIKAAGYVKAKDFHSFYATKQQVVLPAKVERVRQRILARLPVELSNPNMRSLKKEIEKIKEIYNDSMASHWGFVPMEAAEFDYMAADLQQLIDPKMVYIATINGEPAGFIMALPNINEVFHKIKGGRLFPTGIFKLLFLKNKVKGLRVITLGVKHKYLPHGLGSLLYFEMIRNFLDSDYENVEFSWVMEDNHPVNKISELIGATKYKTYRLYSKNIL